VGGQSLSRYTVGLDQVASPPPAVPIGPDE
jgi:hypothetical protein